jgi:uncharacterized protein YjbI with pentapeptide repeats
MSKQRNSILVMIVAVLIGFQTMNTANARYDDDFNQSDYNRVLKGNKNLAGIRIEAADLSGRDLRGADFRGAELEKVNFQNADLRNANFQNADLEEADLKGAKIEGTNFSRAELEYTIWTDGRVCGEDSIGGCW